MDDMCRVEVGTGSRVENVTLYGVRLHHPAWSGDQGRVSGVQFEPLGDDGPKIVVHDYGILAGVNIYGPQRVQIEEDGYPTAIDMNSNRSGPDR